MWDRVIIKLMNNGSLLAHFTFDRTFEEITKGQLTRHDPHGFFGDLTPLSFKKNKYEITDTESQDSFIRPKKKKNQPIIQFPIIKVRGDNETNEKLSQML